MVVAMTETAAETIAETIARPGRHPVRGFLRFIVRLILLIGIPVAAGLIALHFYAATGRYITTENAYVKARKVAISSEVSGRVVGVGVVENQRVKAGDLLVELDAAPFLQAKATALAERDVVLQEIGTRQAALRRARVDVDAANEMIRYAEVEYARQAKLSRTGSGRAALLDAALHEVESARQELRKAEEDVRELISTLGGKANLRAADHALVRQVQVKIDWADTQLGKTRVYAPANGVVARVSLEPGEYVTAGNPLFMVVESDDLWIEVNLKETQLTHLKPGMAATIILDAYPDYEWRAQVASISPATGAEFSLLPPQNASGNWVKVVQRLPIRLNIEAGPGAPTIRAGMTATVSIDSLRDRDLPPLALKIINMTGGRQTLN
jgi:membrane fusion protein (multidrug efflux system)